MKVLVTGSEGFLGKHLCAELERRGHQVYGLDLKGEPDYKGSITDLDFLITMFLDLRLDLVIHLAAMSIVRHVHANPLPGFEVNIMGTAKILEAAKKCDVEGIIVASSDKAYGDNKIPYTEDLPLLGCYPYDVSKACADMLTRAYYRTYGLKTRVTRCSNIYGPGDLNFSRLIPYTIKCLIQEETPKFHAEAGEVYREYTYVDDVVDAYILLAERLEDATGQAFNVGSGFKATRDQVVKKIFQLMGVEISPQLVPSGFKEIRSQYLTSEKIRSLGWQPKVDFEEGLRRTIEWYRRFLR